MYIQFPKERKDQLIGRIQQYFADERSEDIGNLGAENFLDFITKEIGPYYYNQALRDAQSAVDQSMTAIEEDLLSLQRPISDSR